MTGAPIFRSQTGILTNGKSDAVRRWRENWQHVQTQIFGFQLKRPGLGVNEKSKKAQKEKPIRVVCCWPEANGFLKTNLT
jgi:hypothetical protein